jgi:hypothetical protein
MAGVGAAAGPERAAAKVKAVVLATVAASAMEAATETVAATVKEEAWEREAVTAVGMVVERHLAPSPDTHPSFQGCSCSRRGLYRTRRRPHRSRQQKDRCPGSEAYSQTSQMGTPKR